MSLGGIRLAKEVRVLFWPWCAVMVAGLTAWPPPPDLSRIDFSNLPFIVGFCIGIPLLAGLPFGSEVQYRTFSFLLSQPIDRMEIWREKLFVAAVAAFSTGSLYYAGLSRVLPQDQGEIAVAVLWWAAAVASAPLFAIGAGSVIHGLLLNLITQTFVVAVGWALVQWGAGVADGGAALVRNGSIAAFAAAPYAAAMLWLGRRGLRRLEAPGSALDGNVGMLGPSLLPRFLCRSWSGPNSVVVNLVRKELRLLGPLWASTAALISISTLLILLAWFQPERPAALLTAASMFPLLISLILAPLLAGSLSLGDERTLGTHRWHMTLPVSTRLQWWVKLLTAVAAAFVCVFAVLLPVKLHELLFGMPLLDGFRTAGMSQEDLLRLFFYAATLSLPAFWAASASSSALRALLCAPGVAYLVLTTGSWGLLHAPVPEAVIDGWIAAYHPYPFAYNRILLAIAGPDAPEWVVFAPAVVVALVQTRILFKNESGAELRRGVKHLCLLLITVLACVYSVRIASEVYARPHYQARAVLDDLVGAVRALHPDSGAMDLSTPIELSAADLSRQARSNWTASWLDRARVTLEPPGPGARLTWGRRRVYPDYLLSIHLPSGWACSAYGGWLMDEAEPQWMQFSRDVCLEAIVERWAGSKRRYIATAIEVPIRRV